MPRAARCLVPLLALAGCSAEEESAPPEPASALLVTFDTTRGDVFGCYGGPSRSSPTVDRLAAEGVVYEAAYATAPLTLPSHASMLTGLYPLRHGLRDNGIAALPSAAVTLAERAQAAGLATAAFVSAVVLDERFGLGQGFGTYVSPLDDPEVARAFRSEVRASATVEPALAWLDARDRGQRFFLWVHFFDPHAPYDPPPVFSSRFPTRPYWGEVAAADHELGRLLAKLEEQDALAQTVVLVTADHGEAFGEHDELTHGSFLYEGTMRVPLVLRYPDGFEAGRRSDELVSVADVHPTLADALALPPLGPDALALDGQSLFRRRVAADRGVYLESYDGYLSFGWSPLSGWVDARGKYLHSSEPQLFDWRADPREARDLIGERPRDGERYRAAIEAVAALPVLPSDGGAVDPELLRGLQDLGYAGTGPVEEALPHPLAPSDRPSPQSRVGEQRDTIQAMRLHREGHDAEAEPVFRRVLATNPANFLALDGLARTLFAQGRFEESIASFERLLLEGPQWNEARFHLGLALDGAGRSVDALVPMRRALEAEPHNAAFWHDFLAVAERAGNAEDIDRARARLAELEPPAPDR